MAPRKKPAKKSVKIESVKHADKRVNIPTEDLRGFVPEKHQQTPPVDYPGLLYARDPSLDPQLVWKGKDEQDRKPLSVPNVPIYIQEKIHPQAIIEDLRAQSAKASLEADDQGTLFGDFNGLPKDFAERVDFYNHTGNWQNRMILGDSLLAMTSLAERENLKGRVQMIYLDPPYGIKFNSNWQVSTRKRNVKDGKAEDATRQPEQIRAFRDTWELGIHSYLSYLRDRFVVARELLTQSGSIFVQIGDENVHLVRSIMDEVFGADNFISLITIKKTSGQDQSLLNNVSDYILWYAKSKECVKYRQLFAQRILSFDDLGPFSRVQLPDNTRRGITLRDRELFDKPSDIGLVFRIGETSSSGHGGNTVFPFTFCSRVYLPSTNRHWSTHILGMERLGKANRLVASLNTISYVRFHSDFSVVNIGNIWEDTGVGGFTDLKVYVVQTVLKIIERCLLMTTDPGDLVLDPTCGSGTTAVVAEQWGRRWITMDTSRVALALARTRLMAAKYPYYLMADTEEGRQKQMELLGKPVVHPSSPEGDIRKGFVYRTVPHVTLKSIANNEEIDRIHDQYQPDLDSLRKKINTAYGEKWEEWEIPREAPAKTAAKDQKLLADWWELRRKRQAEMDESIARAADQETLVDQPYEDNKRIRVTGPFTVESLSPHRSMSVEKKKELKEKGVAKLSMDVRGAGEFGLVIIDNLKKAGVQNTKKGERLTFDWLDVYPGRWLHAQGEYTEKGGAIKRVAVCIGPEHGTVGTELVKEAAVEAVKGRGFDLLLVCGFSFDPHVNDEAKNYGKLMVLPVRMNPDLSMGDDLLKKTGAANLFMVFGEPDMELRKLKGGQVEMEIRGLDIYDPTTGEIRSNSVDDIACWFLDTDYNGESFFVRHAYFTGAGDPYDKLRRALRAEIDPEAWASLNRTVSRPFDAPKNKKVAVKVINHYGDEVMKVFEL